MTNTLTPNFSFTLKEMIGQHTLVTFNVGPGGEVYVLLAVDPPDYRTAENGAASFAKIVPDAPQRYRVLILRRGELELDLLIEGERFNIHDIQPLGNDLLLVCGRSQYRQANDVDLNARVYARDGRLLRAFLLGDGIATIQATSHGEIWTSYFDEGVFGNYGWNDPVGAAGLVAWSERGDKIHEFEAADPLDAIADCYALNVASKDDVWCYYYTDFPLVHLRKHRIVSAWSVPVAGSHAFAVSGDYALFAGGYDKRDAFHLVHLAREGAARLVGEFTLIGENGETVKGGHAVGRGGTLHVLSDDVLHEIDLDTVVATLGTR